MHAGITGIDWKIGHRCLPCSVSHLIVGAMTIEGRKDDKKDDNYGSDEIYVVCETDAAGDTRVGDDMSDAEQQLSRKVVGTVRKWCLKPGVHNVEQLYIKICYEGHWGLFLVTRRRMMDVEEKEIVLEVRWSDSFFQLPNGPILSKVFELMRMAFACATVSYVV